MMTLGELTSNPVAMWFMGLGVGLVVAVNAWIWARAVGYGQGVRYCMKELEPVRIEIATMAGLHHISEDMRSRMAAMQQSAEEKPETKH
jgi:hypothetical protein